MFDSIASALGAYTPDPSPVRVAKNKRWNMTRRDSFIYKENSAELKERLEQGLTKRKFLVLAKDVNTGLIAVFDNYYITAAYFDFTSHMNVVQRIQAGWCSISNTLWLQYKGGELKFSSPFVQTSAKGGTFVLISYDPKTQLHCLHYGFDRAAKELKTYYGAVRQCVEGQTKTLPDGRTVKVATLKAMTKYFPHWRPSSFRFGIAKDDNFIDAIQNGNRGGFGYHLRKDKSHTPCKCWDQLLQSSF